MLFRASLKRTHMFHACVNELGRLREASHNERIHRQMVLLENTLDTAALTRYYKPILTSSNEFRNPIEKLKTLPYLEKEHLRTAPGSFNASPMPAIPAHTSGTTGTPLRLRRDLYSIAREEAGFFAWYHSSGWRPDDCMIVLRGDMVVPATRKEPPFGIRDVIFNRWVLSSYHLSDRYMPWYIEHIGLSGARFMSAYPSSAYILADFLKRSNCPSLDFKAVFLASETVYDYQREVIEQFLGPAYAQYGNAERTAWLTTCSAGHYHEDVSYGYTEYVPVQDNMYEIVSTSFINRAMPLLRYRTGDLAVDPFGWDDTCACGARGPGCKQIIGRIDDLFITPDGRRIGRLDHVFKGIRHVTAAQIIQHSLTRAEIKLVPAPQYTAADEAMIRRHFLDRVGDTIELTFSYTDTIPRTANGKFRAVVSHVAHQDIVPGDN